MSKPPEEMTNLEYFEYVTERLMNSEASKIFSPPELKEIERERMGKLWKMMDENKEMWFIDPASLKVEIREDGTYALRNNDE